MQAYRYLDPLYGRTSLSVWEAQLMRAPEVQRLRNVRMCNINSLLMTGASQISRFEHSLGVVHLAKEWSAASSASKEEAAIISAAAMLHDIKTGPFGHSLEYIFADSPDLTDLDHHIITYGLEEGYFQKTSANISYYGSRFDAPKRTGKFWSFVSQTIAGKGPLGPLINGSIDIDNIDNVVRLAYHMGLATRDDCNMSVRISRDLRVIGDRLSISSDNIINIDRWQLLRRHLYINLLHDWAEFSAKGMLTKAVELAAKANIIGTDSWILTDDELVRLLVNSSIGNEQEIGDLAKRIMLAKLYYPVKLVRSNAVNMYSLLSEPNTKRQIENRIRDVAKSKCLIHVILDKSKTERKLNLHIRDWGRSIDFGRDSEDILVGLFTSRELNESTRIKVIDKFHSEIHRYLGKYEELCDPLEDPFEGVSEQLRLI